jgi:hypothetical protein
MIIPEFQFHDDEPEYQATIRKSMGGVPFTPPLRDKFL